MEHIFFDTKSVLSTTVEGIRHRFCLGSPTSKRTPYVFVFCEAIETLEMVSTMGVADKAEQSDATNPMQESQHMTNDNGSSMRGLIFADTERTKSGEEGSEAW